MKTQSTAIALQMTDILSMTMKLRIKLIPALTGLLISLSLMSCQKEELIEPVTSGNKNARLSAESIQMPKIYLLSKQDNSIVEYNSDKVMIKVTHSPYYYITYASTQSSESNSMKTSHTYSNGIKLLTTMYPLKDGRLTESISTHFHPQTGAFVREVRHLYQFNAQGKLLKRYNKANVQERIEFFYNSNGDLTKVMEYNAQGVLQKTTQYFYTATALTDKYGFYPDIVGIDPYLKVLGVFFKKLPTSILIDYASPDQTDAFLKYEYELDAYGYPLKRKTFKNVFPTPQFLSARTYDYLKFNIVLQ